MFSRTTSTLLGFSAFLATALAMTMVTGCGESRDTSDPLADVAAAYRKAIREHPAGPSSDPTVNTPDNLRTIARRAESAGRNSNKEAAAILAAGIHGKAGAITLNNALSMESQVKVTMDTISQLIDDAVLLDTSANSRENIDLASSREYLANQRADANQMLAAAEDELDEIRDPIESATTNSQASRNRAAELESEAAGLAQQGLDKGPLQGHGLIEESIDLRRQAHGQRITAAREEITLVELQPSQRLAQQGRQSHQDRLDAARDSEARTSNRQDEAAEYAQSTRAQIEEIRGRLAPILQQLSTEQTQAIIPGFEAAAQDYAASASAARRATSGGSTEQKNEAWLAVSSGEIGAGRVHWAMANSIQAQAHLLNKLAQSGNLLGDASRWQSDLDQMLKAHTEAIAAAKASYESALQSLGNVRSNAEETNRIRASIELAMQAMDGADLVAMESSRRDASTTAKRPTTPRGTGSGANVDRSAPGFATPQAVIQAFPPDSWPGVQHLVASMSANDPGSQEILKLVNNAIAALKPYADACIEKFGTMGTTMDGLSQVAPGGDVAPRVLSESGDSAVLIAGEDEDKLYLVKRNGRWFINLDETIAEGTKDDPQAAQMLPMIGMMISPIIQQVKTVSEEVAAGIRNGTYPTIEDAQAAFEEKTGEIIGQLLGGMGGGAPGMGGPPGMGGGFPGGGFPGGGN